jgi:hypothetical protein
VELSIVQCSVSFSVVTVVCYRCDIYRGEQSSVELSIVQCSVSFSVVTVVCYRCDIE